MSGDFNYSRQSCEHNTSPLHLPLNLCCQKTNPRHWKTCRFVQWPLGPPPPTHANPIQVRNTPSPQSQGKCCSMEISIRWRNFITSQWYNGPYPNIVIPNVKVKVIFSAFSYIFWGGLCEGLGHLQTMQLIFTKQVPQIWNTNIRQNIFLQSNKTVIPLSFLLHI